MTQKDNQSSPISLSPIVRFLKTNFHGVLVTITLVNGDTFTGAVVNGFDNIVGIKVGNVTIHINALFITHFV